MVTEIVLEPRPQIEKGPFNLAISNISREIKFHRKSDNKTLQKLAENIDLDNIRIFSHQVKFPLKSDFAEEKPYEIYFSLLSSLYHLKYARMEITII